MGRAQGARHSTGENSFAGLFGARRGDPSAPPRLPVWFEGGPSIAAGDDAQEVERYAQAVRDGHMWRVTLHSEREGGWTRSFDMASASVEAVERFAGAYSGTVVGLRPVREQIAGHRVWSEGGPLRRGANPEGAGEYCRVIGEGRMWRVTLCHQSPSGVQTTWTLDMEITREQMRALMDGELACAEPRMTVSKLDVVTDWRTA